MFLPIANTPTNKNGGKHPKCIKYGKTIFPVSVPIRPKVKCIDMAIVLKIKTNSLTNLSNI